MANKPTKPIRLAPQTKEEQEMQVARFFANKREQFAINILCNLCQVAPQRVVATMDSTKLTLDTTGLVDKAVEMADRLIQKLYPVVKEEKK